MTAENHIMIFNSRTHYGTVRRGFTLAEAMMAVFVLGIAAASVLLPFMSGAAVRAEGVNRTLAARLASDLMEKILLLPFHDTGGGATLGPESGESDPTKYDSINDYHGYAEPQGQVKDATGAVFTDSAYANFSRNVTCEYHAMSPQPEPGSLDECDFISITVNVSYSGRQMATIVRLVSE
jgi:prepilin-type N-terminal cleavage/methylation domain-containing protein